MNVSANLIALPAKAKAKAGLKSNMEHCKCCIKNKKIQKNNRINYNRSKKGVYTAIYGQQKRKSKDRGHKPPTYTKQELVGWMVIYGFQGLYDTWAMSGYVSDLKPSVDRLDINKGYSFENIRLVTWAENNKADQDRKGKAVYQIKDGKIINQFNSTHEAERQTGIHHTGIGAVALGYQIHAGGYQWKYEK